MELRRLDAPNTPSRWPSPRQAALSRLARQAHDDTRYLMSRSGMLASFPFKEAKAGFRGALLRAACAGWLCKASPGQAGMGLSMLTRTFIHPAIED